MIYLPTGNNLATITASEDSTPIVGHVQLDDDELVVVVDGEVGDEVANGDVGGYVPAFLVDFDAGVDAEGGEVGVEFGGEEGEMLLDGGFSAHIDLDHLLELGYLELHR